MVKTHSTPKTDAINLRSRFRAGLHWVVLYALLWLLLAEGSGWYIGLFMVLAAAALTVRLGLHLPRVKWRFLPGFLLFFGREMVVGGWDVARRACTPTLRLSPRWTHYHFITHRPRVRMAVSACIGLLPGTLSSGLDGDSMHVHVLDEHSNWLAAVQALETHLDRLFPEVGA